MWVITIRYSQVNQRGFQVLVALCCFLVDISQNKAVSTELLQLNDEGGGEGGGGAGEGGQEQAGQGYHDFQKTLL